MHIVHLSSQSQQLVVVVPGLHHLPTEVLEMVKCHQSTEVLEMILCHQTTDLFCFGWFLNVLVNY